MNSIKVKLQVVKNIKKKKNQVSKVFHLYQIIPTKKRKILRDFWKKEESLHVKLKADKEIYSYISDKNSSLKTVPSHTIKE